MQSVYEDELLKLVEKCPEKNLVIKGAQIKLYNSKIKGKIFG